MRTLSTLIFISSLALAGIAQNTAPRRTINSPNAENLQHKLEYIEQNAERNPPSSAPLLMQEAEVNAWFASSYAKLPKGVRSLKLLGDSGKVVANARVDFDEIKEGRSSNNLLMALFNGIHDVQVVATTRCDNGEAEVHVQSVSLDGSEIPRVALNFFIDRYLKPKYPNIGIDSTFRPGYRIVSAFVGRHQLTVIQK